LARSASLQRSSNGAVILDNQCLYQTIYGLSSLCNGLTSDRVLGKEADELKDYRATGKQAAKPMGGRMTVPARTHHGPFMDG